MKRYNKGKKCEICNRKWDEIAITFHTNTGQYLCPKHGCQIDRYEKIRTESCRDPNKIIRRKGYVEIVLKNIKLQETGRALIDLEDIEKVKKYKWCIDGHGYVISRKKIGKKYKQIKIYHLIVGQREGYMIDHINRNPLDNRKYNLRFVTSSQNQMNRIGKKNSVTGIKGVQYSKNNGNPGYEATIYVDRKKISKYCLKKEDAVRYRKELEKKYFGEYNLKENTI